jgi:hypothetical protein
MDPDADPDPAIFVMTSKIKSQKEDTKQYRNQGFSYYFCLVIEGSDTDTGGPKLMLLCPNSVSGINNTSDKY